MKKYIPLLFSILLGACSAKPKEAPPVIDNTPTIDLETAIYNQLDKMNLSEFVDSIAYFPMKRSYFKTGLLLRYSKPYYYGVCKEIFNRELYDNQGKYIGPIGGVGVGPGKEISEYGYKVFYDEDKDLFYTLGHKLIQFDKNREFTGKELQLKTVSKKTGRHISGMKSPYGFARAGKYNMLINFPDSVYWMDENLHTVRKQRIIPEDLYLSTPGRGTLVWYTLSTHNDTTRFFNCFTDKLYAVNEDSLVARWKIHLGDLKVENKYLLNELYELFEKKLPSIEKTFYKYGSREARILAAKSKFGEAIDGRYWVTRVYESDRYVWIAYKKMFAFDDYRILHNNECWAVFDKQTGVMKTAARLVNDVDYLTDFNVMNDFIGINDGVLTMVIWPKGPMESLWKWRKKNKLPVGKEIEELVAYAYKYKKGVLVHAYLKK